MQRPERGRAFGARADARVVRALCACARAAREAPDVLEREYDALRDELVVAHLNLVRFLAVKFANRGEPLDDLVQVGTVGLLKAIDRFERDRGVEFTTYATPTIVGEIKRYFRDKGWAVKVPRRLQELNLAVNRANEKMSVELGRSPTVRELAEQLGRIAKKRFSKRRSSGRPTTCSRSTPKSAARATRRSQTLADTVGITDPGPRVARRPRQSRARLPRADRPRARDHLPALLRIGLADRDRQAPQRLADARLAPQAKALEKLRRRAWEELAATRSRYRSG